MPIPAFARQTDPDPLAPEVPFAMIGTRALAYMRDFGARNWYVFSALLLRSDAEGLAEISLPDLSTDLGGMNRDTLQAALAELAALRVADHRVLRKVPALKFGANHYVLFPDRDGAPLAEVAETAVPSPLTKIARKQRADKPTPPKRPAAPVSDPAPKPEESLPLAGWVDDEDDDAPVDGAASSGKFPLLQPLQVAETFRYLGSTEAAETFRYPIRGEKPESVEKENTDKQYGQPTAAHADGKPPRNQAKPLPTMPARPPGPAAAGDSPRSRRQAPARDPQHPTCAADILALYIDLYGATCDGNKPLMNLGAFGKRMANAIRDGRTPEQVAAVVRYFFAPGHSNSAKYAGKNYAGSWFIMTFGEIEAASLGRHDEVRAFQSASATRRKSADAARMGAKTALASGDAPAAGGDDIIPPHLRALEAEYNALNSGDDYSHLTADTEAAAV